MSLLRVAADEIFWDRWSDKFTYNANDYISPNNKAVDDAVEDAGVCDSCPKDKKVDDVWEYVNETIRYKLTKEWKVPEQTLNEGGGDCEDMSFLASSMLLNIGIDGFDFVIGDLIGVGDGVEKHTWLEVDGRIVDPTAPMGGNGNLEYRAEKKFTIISGDR